ncbi:type II toxin-antitoxin system Phd/YefM family antitoxin [Microlunatus antarcticus]
MIQVEIGDMATRLSELLQSCQDGEEVLLVRAGKPAVRLLLVDRRPPRVFGRAHVEVPVDFDAPLDRTELSEWE